jgi:hypothetical protein
MLTLSFRLLVTLAPWQAEDQLARTALAMGNEASRSSIRASKFLKNHSNLWIRRQPKSSKSEQAALSTAPNTATPNLGKFWVELS